MPKLSITDLDLEGRRVFMRVDFNVPVSDGRIDDDSRIRAALPSIEYAVKQDGRLILASHMGRPKGKRVASESLAPVARRLEEIMGRPVAFAPDSIGSEVAAMAGGMADGDVLLLENLRFHPEEEKNDPEFSKALASLCDVYVNDAFGTAHRAHASTAGITAYVGQAAAGFLMRKEIESLGRALAGAGRPYVAIVGGAKISGKIELIESFLTIADEILIGGAMAYTFLRAQGIETGKSLVEEDRVELARDLMKTAETRSRRIRLPEDHVVAKDLDGAGLRSIPVRETAPDEMGLDIGPRTVAGYGKIIASAQTVVWNGPMGVFEKPRFGEGTFAVARAVAASHAFSIIGGGDSASAIHQSGLADQINHVSTGGGAALEFLSGKKLPGVEALTEK